MQLYVERIIYLRFRIGFTYDTENQCPGCRNTQMLFGCCGSVFNQAFVLGEAREAQRKIGRIGVCSYRHERPIPLLR